jgi:hypothetical protein
MAFETIGFSALASLLMADAVYAAFDHDHAYLGVGDSDDAFDLADTDLQASTNKLRKGMETAFPSRTANAITFKAHFATNEANWAWKENCIANHATAGQMLTRKVETLVTKTSASEIYLTKTLTIAQA